MNAQCIMVCSGKGGTGKVPSRYCWGPAWHGWAARPCWWSWTPVCAAWTLSQASMAAPFTTLRMFCAADARGAKAVVPSPLYPGLSVISAPYEGGAVEAAPLGRLLTAMRSLF